MKLRNCLLAAIMVASTAMVAMAQEKTFAPYASIRYFIGAYYQDKYFVNNDAAATAPATYGTKADRHDLDLVQGMAPGVSRFGARFADGNLTGQVEFGLFGGHNGRVGVRQAWGAYKFDFGLQVLAGNTDAPWYKPAGSEAWEVYGGPGWTMGDRAPQIKLSLLGLGSPTSFAYVALQRPPTNGSIDSSFGYWSQYNTGSVAGAAGRDVFMPVTTVGYEYKSDMADIGVGATFYKYFVRRGAEGGAYYPDPLNPGGGLGAGLDHSLMAYMGFINGNIKLGGPFVKFNFAYEKAPMLLGITGGGPYYNGVKHGLGDRNKLSDVFLEGALEVGYNSPDFGFGLSFGYVRNISSDANSADRLGVGLNVYIPVAKGFRVVPTALYMDERKDAAKNKQGADCLAGIKLQYDL